MVFLSFEDILRDGIPADVDIIINAGRRDDAWSGGRDWSDPRIVEKLTGWVAGGGGFIGVGEPSSAAHGGKFFQLSHLLGVDRELGLSTARAKYAYAAPAPGHFITADLARAADFGKDVDGIHALDGKTTVLLDAGKSPRITVRAFGKGRSVYLSGHKYSATNIRLLHRAILWAARGEKHLDRWHCRNPDTECAYYPRHQKLVVANLTAKPQVTLVTLGDGKKTKRVTVPGYGCKVLDA
jgi:beta-D-galactosyl-(1->4)-L-rhamnose phosphorylase